jgi:hypothetical protein
LVQTLLTWIAEILIVEMRDLRGPHDSDFCNCAVDRKFPDSADFRWFQRTPGPDNRERELRFPFAQDIA